MYRFAILLTAFVLLTGTPVWANDEPVWTIDDHIGAIQAMLDKAHEIQEFMKTQPLTPKEREAASMVMNRDIADLEAWLALAKKVQQGDYEALRKLHKKEKDRHSTFLTSAEYLGLDDDAYTDYLRQATAQSNMFHRLFEAH